MTYLLDTNVCIYLKRTQPSAVVEVVQALGPPDVGISSVTLAELEYGVTRSRHRGRDRRVLNELFQLIEVVPFDAAAARHFGEIRAALELIGTTIGPFDTQIAAYPRSLDVTLVTHNTREFERVPGLSVVDWS